MPASLTHHERMLHHLRISLMREVEAGHVKIEQCDGILADELCKLLFTSPMLIRAEKDRVVLTDAGREYLAACDPVPGSC